MLAVESSLYRLCMMLTNTSFIAGILSLAVSRMLAHEGGTPESVRKANANAHHSTNDGDNDSRDPNSRSTRIGPSMCGIGSVSAIARNHGSFPEQFFASRVLGVLTAAV